MATSTGRLLRSIATRGVIAALPVAMASAYASGIFIQPPRLAAEVDYVPVAEITAAPTTIGIADSPLYGMSRAEIDKTLDKMLSIGVTNIRVFVPWGLVEPLDNQYNWTHIQDVMDAAAARNMGVLAEINATPLWAAVNPPGPGTILFPGSDTPKVEAFVDFMKVFVGKYANTVSAYEIWNEPNWVGFAAPIDPEAYAALLKAVYPVIKDAAFGLDKTATVVAGALGTVQNHPFGFTMSPVDFVQRMMAAGAGNFFDALSIHPYNEEIPITGTCPTCPAWMLTPRQQLEAIKLMIQGKKIWITEYGLPTTPIETGFTELQQAAWLKEMLDYWQTFGDQAGPVFLYNLRDKLLGSVDPQANYGFFYNNWDPKAAAAMLKTWIETHLLLPPPVTQQPAANPIAQFFAAIQQMMQSFSQALSQMFNPGSIIQSIVQAIQGLFGVRPAPAPAAVVTTSALVGPESARMVALTADTEPATDATVSGDVASEAEGVPAADAEPAATPIDTAPEPASGAIETVSAPSDVTPEPSEVVDEQTDSVEPADDAAVDGSDPAGADGDDFDTAADGGSTSTKTDTGKTETDRTDTDKAGDESGSSTSGISTSRMSTTGDRSSTRMSTTADSESTSSATKSGPKHAKASDAGTASADSDAGSASGGASDSSSGAADD